MRVLPYLMLFVLGCQQQNEVPINNISDLPAVQAGDTAYANVYKPLDGIWEGTFYIYEDTNRGKRNDAFLYDLRGKPLIKRALKLTDSIRVRQHYTSRTPYFQTVQIRDYYPERGDTVVSEGVNKVQNSQMWCVVRKPEETVIHRGSLDNGHTIIWQRSEQNPQKIEYFRETVSDSTYVIIGWGYYEGQDTSIMPQLWFKGLYQRP